MQPIARAKIRRAIANSVTLLICAVVLAPIAWGLSTSLKKPEDILAYPPELIPSDPTLENYALLFREGIAAPMLNSTLITGLTVVFCLFIGFLAAYAMARFEFRGKSFLLLLIIAVMSIPLPSLLVPTYTFLFHLGLLDTRTGLVLLYTAYQLPLAVWILYGYISTLPEELDHAAMIDGYSRMQIIAKIIFPLSRIGLIAAGLFILTFAWNDFIIAVIMNGAESGRTLPVAVFRFLGVFGREWGPLTASSMLSVVPIIIVFVLFQRYFLSGITGGSVKG